MLTCSHCGSARGTRASIPGDRARRAVFVCLACERISSPLTCTDYVTREGTAERDWCGAPAVVVCAGCSKPVCRSHAARVQRRRESPRCGRCARIARHHARLQTVRVLPHPSTLWYSGVD